MSGKLACLDCQFGDAHFPCRTDGQFNPGKLASAYRTHVLNDRSETGKGGTHWSFSCMGELIDTDPMLALDLVLRLAAQIDEDEEAGSLAAGPLEDLIACHGETVIDRIEAEARTSARFRYLLSGVWPQRQQDGPIWQRVLAARAAGPDMDLGDRLPPLP